MALLCGLSAALFVFVWLSDTSDPVTMPKTPPWATAAFAASGAVLMLLSTRHGEPRPRARIAMGVASCTGMLAGSVLAVPHTVLLIVIRAGATVTGGTGSFDVEPVWSSAAAHLLNLTASLALGRWLLLSWRERRGRCLTCGGSADAAPTQVGGLHALPWLAAIAIAACLPYGLLKLAWGLGSRVGLTGHAFDDVSLTSPGFGDTVVLTLISVWACLVMGRAVRRRIVRRAALAMGTLGSLMLVPVGVVGAVMLVLMPFTDRSIDDSEIAPWAFGLVYLSFITWGATLALLTFTYWRTTRPRCDRPVHRERTDRDVASATDDLGARSDH